MQQASSSKDKKRKSSEGACDFLNRTREAQAEGVQGTEQREERDRDGRLEGREVGRKLPHVFGDGNGGIGNDGAVTEPVGPADDEADTRPEGASSVDIEAARGWHSGAELRDRESAQHCVDAASDPHELDEPEIAQLGGDGAGETQDANSDRATKGDSEAEAETENADEA